MPPIVGPDALRAAHLSVLRSMLLFAHRHHRKAALAVVAAVIYIASLSVAVQLLYPPDHALPGARLAGSFISWQDETQVLVTLKELNQRPITLKLADTTYQVTPEEAGLNFATQTNVGVATHYPYRQRLIPFSIFFERQAFLDSQIHPAVDQAKLERFASRLVTSSHIHAIEGTISITNGAIHEQPPKVGSQFAADQIAARFMKFDGAVPASITMPGQSESPQYSSAAIHAAAVKASRLVQPFFVTINGDQYRVSAATVGDWITFTPDAPTHSFVIGFDQSAIAAYVDAIAKDHYVAPTSTTVSLLDGHEIGRQAGSPGKHVSPKNGAEVIAAALADGERKTTLYVSPVGSPVHYIRHYSNSQAGLQALLDYLVSSKGTYGITVQEISSRGWSASSKGTRQFVTASTYKLFVAYSTLKRIESGAFHWNDNTAGTTLSTCMNRMIIISDNACAEALAKRIGYSTVINEMHGLGLHATSHSDTFYSTSNDESILLTKLATGKILNSSDRNFLLGLMKQQIYRSGIPAGTGVVVADKVGFLWTLLNDAAIVYSPNSTYVLVIMTDHSSWSQIADTAHQIQSQMSR